MCHFRGGRSWPDPVHSQGIYLFSVWQIQGLKVKSDVNVLLPYILRPRNSTLMSGCQVSPILVVWLPIVSSLLVHTFFLSGVHHKEAN